MAERKIGSRTFKVEPMLALDAIELQVRLAPLIEPLLKTIGELASRGGKKVEDQDNVAFFKAVVEMITKLPPREFALLVKDVAEIAMIQRPSGYSQVDVDGDFSGNLGELMQLVAFVLQEQFSDFFGGNFGGGAILRRKAS